MKSKIFAILVLTTIATLITLKIMTTQQITDPNPPIWPEAFEQSFDETFVTDKEHDIVNGMLYYDAGNNRSRLDRASGTYDKFCTSLQNISTPCINLVVESKRYIYFPNKKACCICCDAEHGCGILKRDWLSGADYLGEDKLSDHVFQKWSKDGVVGYNHYWNTPDDNKIPRKIDEDGTHIFDFNIYSYKKRPQSSGLFDVPDYCKQWCPKESFCGKFQSSSLTRADHPLII